MLTAPDVQPRFITNSHDLALQTLIVLLAGCAAG